MTRRIFLAADLGAGNTKLWSSRSSKPWASIPSMIARVDPAKFIQGDKDVLPSNLYQLGDEAWFVGDEVVDRGLIPDDPSQDANLKTENALPLLLSSVVSCGYAKPGETVIGCVVSHHAPVEVGARLREMLQGKHKVCRDGEWYQIEVVLPEHGILQEGSRINGLDHAFATLDLGNLTNILIRRSRSGDIVESLKNSCGVGRLVSMIAASTGLRNEIGGIEPERSVIASGILELSRKLESGTAKDKNMYYRANGDAINFTGDYKACLAGWIGEATKNASKAIAQNRGTDFKVIAIGGGCLLPGVAGLLKKAGIEIYEGASPLFANVHSLYQHSAARYKRDKAFAGMFEEELAIAE